MPPPVTPIAAFAPPIVPSGTPPTTPAPPAWQQPAAPAIQQPAAPTWQPPAPPQYQAPTAPQYQAPTPQWQQPTPAAWQQPAGQPWQQPPPPGWQPPAGYPVQPGWVAQPQWQGGARYSTSALVAVAGLLLVLFGLIDAVGGVWLLGQGSELSKFIQRSTISFFGPPIDRETMRALISPCLPSCWSSGRSKSLPEPRYSPTRGGPVRSESWCHCSALWSGSSASAFRSRFHQEPPCRW